MLGKGDWAAYITDRGGSPVRWQVPWSALEGEHVRNASGRISATLGIDAESYATCCEILNEAEPWQHELALFRGPSPTPAHVGPIIEMRGDQIVASDLYGWMAKRRVGDDLVFSMDAALVFQQLFTYLRDLEDSMNVDIQAKRCGIDVLRKYLGDDEQRGSDLLSELGRSGVNFTVHGRTVLVGGLEEFFAATPPLLLDDGVISAVPTKLGADLATDVAVIGAQLTNNAPPVKGRAVRGSTRYGLLQESYVEPLIRDPESADRNALERVMAQQPAPKVLDATLSPSAAVEYEDLLGGMHFDVRLAAVSGCVAFDHIMQTDRITARVSASQSGIEENISCSLVPLSENPPRPSTPPPSPS